MSVKEISSATFDQEVLKSKVPVVLKFGATWCGPCRQMEPVLAKFAEENLDVNVFSVDVDEAPELASKFSIRSVPTTFVFKNGTVVASKVGFAPLTTLRELIKNG